MGLKEDIHFDMRFMVGIFMSEHRWRTPACTTFKGTINKHRFHGGVQILYQLVLIRGSTHRTSPCVVQYLHFWT